MSFKPEGLVYHTYITRDIWFPMLTWLALFSADIGYRLTLQTFFFSVKLKHHLYFLFRENSKNTFNDILFNIYLPSKNLFNLPRVTKSLINSVHTTLPTKGNLALVRLGFIPVVSSVWKSQDNHVLSGCPIALNHGCFTWQHGSVLDRITTFITLVDSSELEIYSDAGGRAWTIPPDITHIQQAQPCCYIKIPQMYIYIWIESAIWKKHQYRP